jgi:Putative Flp pilus-assembly TadE/G-like
MAIAGLDKFKAATTGNVATMFALSLLPAISLAGLGLDYMRATNDRERALSALDSALLAAVAVEDTSQQETKAATLFNATVTTIGAEIISQTFEQSGSDLAGTVTLRMPTTLLSALGLSEINLTVSATARKAAPVAGAPCIILLDPSRVQSLLVNSGARLIAPQCEVHVHTSATPASIFNAASDLTTQRICIRGSNIIDNGGTHPNIELGCTPTPDPYAATMAAPVSTTCPPTIGGNYNGGTITFSPGVYCGWHNFNSTTNVNFQPGVYVIKDGGWNVNGGVWTGNGVTFYFADTSKIQFNSAMEQTLKAPTSGPFKDVLFAEAPSLPKSDFIFNNSNGQEFEGLIYLPSRNVTFNSTTRVTSERLGMVFNSVIFDDTDMKIGPLNGSSSSAPQSPVLVR